MKTYKEKFVDESNSCAFELTCETSRSAYYDKHCETKIGLKIIEGAAPLKVKVSRCFGGMIEDDAEEISISVMGACEHDTLVQIVERLHHILKEQQTQVKDYERV